MRKCLEQSNPECFAPGQFQCEHCNLWYCVEHIVKHQAGCKKQQADSFDWDLLRGWDRFKPKPSFVLLGIPVVFDNRAPSTMIVINPALLARLHNKLLCGGQPTYAQDEILTEYKDEYTKPPSDQLG